MRPKASQSAKDILIELPERDSSRLMKKPLARGRETYICGFLSGTKALSSRSQSVRAPGFFVQRSWTAGVRWRTERTAAIMTYKLGHMT